MSLVETLHQARKARLQRIAARAVPQAEPAGGPPPVVSAPQRRSERNYERAWAYEMLGVREPSDHPPPKLQVQDIQRAAARHFNVRRNEMLSQRRAAAIARPRHVAMFLAKELTTKSYPEIGRCFGGRDHSTVLHAVRRIEMLLPHDAELAASIDRIRQMLDV